MLKTMQYDRQILEEILNLAIDELFENHIELLEVNVSERSLTHHFANSISSKISGYHVDVEYNRHQFDIKKIMIENRLTSDRTIEARTVFPDIIVHHRKSDNQNLLVIEVKKPRESIEYDLRKLGIFMRDFNYQFAASVSIGMNNKKLIRKIIWVGEIV
jgi:hypothetical protein